MVIKLYIDRNKDGNWELAAEMRDQGSKYGKMPFWGEGYAGLRSDLMDLEFDNYMINADTLKL